MSPGSLRHPTDDLRAAVRTALADARQQIEELRGQVADWQQRHAELQRERNAQVQELARADVLREATREAELRSAELQLAQKRWRAEEAGLRQELEGLRERCQEAERELAGERDRRAALEAGLAAAQEELSELRPLLELLEAATGQDRRGDSSS